MKLRFGLYNVSINKQFTIEQYSDIESNLSVDVLWESDMKETIIQHDFRTNGKTAQIELDTLVDVLARMYEIKPFKKLEFTSNYYSATPEQLMQMVLLRNIDKIITDGN